MTTQKPGIVQTAQLLGCLPDRKSGSKHVGGCCPVNHGSKGNRSFWIYPNTESYYCWNCQRGGDSWDLIRLAKGCDFKDAVSWAQEEKLVSGNGWKPAESNNTRRLHEILTAAANFFHQSLPDQYRGHLNKHYGLNDEIIGQYQIGFAPTDQDALVNHLQGSFKLEEIKKTGLLTKWGKSHFQGQLVFPYWHQGKVKYLIARQTDQSPKWKAGKYDKLPVHDAKDRPYISPDITNAYFYGEDSLKDNDRCYVAEGVTDCLIALQHDLPAISPVTTSFREADWPKLTELCKGKTVYLVPDNEANKAGFKGAEKTRLHLEEKGIQCFVVKLPRREGRDKIDLNEYVRDNGIDVFLDLLKEQCKPQPRSIFDVDLKQFSAARFLDSKPRPIIWLLQDTLPLRKFGMLVSDGGVGKGYLSLQLGLSVATGIPFLDGQYELGTTGKVYLCYGEDDEDTLHHRLSAIVESLVDRDSRADIYRAVAHNLMIQSVCGQDSRLIQRSDGNLLPSVAYCDLLDRLQAIQGLKLVIVDPLSRFYAADEVDAPEATYFCSLLEAISQQTGATVITSQHVNRTSVYNKTGLEALTQHAIRGSTGFTNAARWQLNMARLNFEEAKPLGIDPNEIQNYLVAKVTKKNLGPPERHFYLRRDEHGALRRAHVVESRTDRDREVLAEIVAKIIEESSLVGKRYTLNTFAKVFKNQWSGYGERKIKTLVEEAIEAGKISLTSGKNTRNQDTEYLTVDIEGQKCQP